MTERLKGQITFNYENGGNEGKIDDCMIIFVLVNMKLSSKYNNHRFNQFSSIRLFIYLFIDLLIY